MSSDSGTSLPEGEEKQILDVDELHYLLQAKQEGTQKKTFTNWINSQLSKRPQPSVITNLFKDLENGHVLLDLLEVLSGEELKREKGRNVFQSRSNIETVLTFLEKQSIKLINIHVEDIITGKPSIVLGLIWKIILHFHIEGLAEALSNAEEESENAASPTASPPTKKSAKSLWKMSAKKALLQWANEKCAQQGSIGVKDFKSSWKNGLAFLAIIHSLRPDSVDMEKIKDRTDEENLREAFRIAEEELQIPRLLEPEDVNVPDPDEKSIMTYVAQFLHYSKPATEPKKDISIKVKKAVEWLDLENQTLKELFDEMKSKSYAKKYHEILLYMKKFNDQKRVFLADLSMKSLPDAEEQLIKQSLQSITSQIADWKRDLDRSLPPPLDTIETWLTDVESLMSQNLPECDTHYNTVSLLENVSASYKDLVSRASDYLEKIKSFKTLDVNGEILVPSDKMEEMKARTLKITMTNFYSLIDYRCSGHYVLALLEDAKPRLKMWTAKYKTQESVEALLADWNDFMEKNEFMFCLETAFKKFRELRDQLAASEEYSSDNEVFTEYETIELKYKGFQILAQQAKSNMENVQTSWTHFENNITLITFWLDEQQRIPLAKVPKEIMSKWESVLASLNKDGNFLMEKTTEKMASKLSSKLKSVNSRWAKYLKIYKAQKETVTDGKAPVDSSEEDQALKNLGSFSLAAEEHLSEVDIKTNFESSKSKLEAYITAATGLLGQRLTPDEFISQYEKTLGGFSDESLDTFLKFADQMKNISGPNEKSTVDSVSADIRSRWKIIHTEIETYIFQLKMHVEKKKFDDLFCKLEKQINKEKECNNVREMEELTRNHEILFSEDGCRGQLNGCVQAMKVLCDTRQAQKDYTEAIASVAEYAKNKAQLEKRAEDVYSKLLSRQDQLQVPKKHVSLTALENGEKTDILCSNGTLSSQEISEADRQDHHNGRVTYEHNTANGSSTLEIMAKRYNEEKSHLEHLLQSTRERFTIESPQEAQDLTELQRRLHQLQTLQDQANSYWTLFESTSQALENLVNVIERIKLLKKRNIIHSDKRAIDEEIANRMQSLAISINILLPIQQDVALLHEVNKLPPNQEMDKFTLSNISMAYRELKHARTSVEDHIQQCENLESENVDPSSSVEIQPVQSIVQHYKTQLEATNETIHEREATLKTLENFFSKLQKTKLSIQAEAVASFKDTRTVEEKQSKLDALEKQVSQLREEAEKLDVSLQAVGISLEDPKVGGETSCLKMVSGFFGMLQRVQRAVAEEPGNLEKIDDLTMQTMTQKISPPVANKHISLVYESNKLQDQSMEIFTASHINSVIQEIKGVRSSIEEEKEQLENRDFFSVPCSEVDGELSPAVFQEQPTVHHYKMQLIATNKTMKEREDTLKSLKEFLSTLESTKDHIEAQFVNSEMDKSTLLEKQKRLETLEKNIYSLGQEAEKLDVSLQTSEILLEDPEIGGPTSCQKMISGFFERLERAQEAVTEELRSKELKEKIATLSVQQKEFCRRIQDIQDRIDKTGLKDPTIPSVQKRLKIFLKLEKELNSYAKEKCSVADNFAQIPTAQLKGIEGLEECETVWEDVWQLLIHSKEQCEKVLDLLRRFKICRTILTSLIQKGESTLSQQSSYMGKENLQKMIAKVDAVKQELNENSENVEEINSICKNLQFHLSKMKSFGSPPFQSEANLMTDKWLDMFEKIVNYEENLKTASNLWNKIICLSKDIEQWSDSKIRMFEDVSLTKNDVPSLNIELQNQERNLEEINKKTNDIQNILQNSELPLELQVINTSLLNKIELIRLLAARIPENMNSASQLSAVVDAPETSSAGEDLTPKSSFLTNETPTVNVIKTEVSGSGEDARNVSPHLDDKTISMEAESGLVQNNLLECTVSTNEVQRPSEESKNLDDKLTSPLDVHWLKLTELKKIQESFNSDLQPGLQEKLAQLSNAKQLLEESQDHADRMKSTHPEVSLSSSGVDGDQWFEVQNAYKCFLGQLQDTMQILVSRVQRHQHYESLSAALNSKMTSFSEELLNFTGSSWGTTACEKKRHKLQELHAQFEGIDNNVKELLAIAESVKQETSLPGISTIEETLETYCGKIGDFNAQLEPLEQDLPQASEKRKIKKTKKVKPIPSEPSTSEPLVPALQEESVKGKKGSKGQKKKRVVSETIAGEKLKPEVQLLKEIITTENQEEIMDHKVELVTEPNTEENKNMENRSRKETVTLVTQTIKMDHKEQQVVSEPIAVESEDQLLKEIITPEYREETMGHKVEELHAQFEEIDNNANELLAIAESVEQETSLPGISTNEETLETYCGKIGDFNAQLEPLEQDLPQASEKRKIKKTKKVKPISSEPSVPSTSEPLVPALQEESVKGKKGSKGQKKKKVVSETIAGEKLKPEDQLLKEIITTENQEEIMDHKVEVVTEPNTKENINMENRSRKETVTLVTQTIAMDHKEQISSDQQSQLVNDFDRRPEEVQDLVEWLNYIKTRFQTLKDTPCGQHQLPEKIYKIQAMCAEITQKKIDLDVTGATSETVDEKPLERTTEEQEAIGQLEKLVYDFDCYRRQLESALSDLTACNEVFKKMSGLFSSIEERLCSELPLNEEQKSDILKGVQPLYEEVTSCVESFHKSFDQAVALNISCNTIDVEPMISKTFDRVTKKMTCLSTSGHSEKKEEDSKNGEDSVPEHYKTLEPSYSTDKAILQAPDIHLLGEVNTETSNEDLPPSSESLQIEDNLTKEFELHLVKCQQEMEVIFASIQELLQIDFKTLQQCSTQTSWKNLLHNLKSNGQDVRMLSEENPGVLTRTEVENKLGLWRKRPLELDGAEADRQAQDIEKIYEEVSKLESPTSCLREGTSSFQGGGLVMDGSNTKDKVSWSSLISELDTLKIQKQKERQAIKDYQNALRSAKSSLKRLSKERENLKMGQSEIHTDHLEKIQNFLNKLAKEKDTFHTLKAEQAKIGAYGISRAEKEKIEMDVKQIEEYWEQTELMVEKKRDNLVKEAEELKFLKQKVGDVRDMIQVQHDLLGQINDPAKGSARTLLFVTADLKATKHLFSSLRNAIDLQTKRSWGQSECRSLENSLEDLQSQLENIERRVNEVQMTASQTPDVILEQHTFLKPLYEALTWIKNINNRALFENTVALLPEDVEEQILDSRNLQKEIVDRKSAVLSDIEKSKSILSRTGVPIFEDFNSFFHQLQELYEGQIIQSAQRLKLLESGAEKRKMLFTEIEKLEELLQGLENDTSPVKRGVFSASELCEQLNCLKAKRLELGKIEGLVLTLLKNSQNYHHELNISEQLYLNDLLRSLKIKASTLRKLEEKKFSYLEKIKSIYDEFQERTRHLIQEQNTFQNSDPESYDRRIPIENQLQVVQNATPLPSNHWSQINRYKDLFKESGLDWDSSTVDNFQEHSKSIAASVEDQVSLPGTELIAYQKMLEKIQIMISIVQREATVIGRNFNLIHLHVLLQKVKKIAILIEEAVSILNEKMSPDQPVVHIEKQKMKTFGECMDRLHQSLTQLKNESQVKQSKENIQCRLKSVLSSLKKVDTELQEPIFIELDIPKIEAELLRLEAINEIVKLELHDLRSTLELESKDDLKDDVHELNDIENRIETNVSQHIKTYNKSREALQKLQDANSKAAEQFRKSSELHRCPVNLSTLERGAESSDFGVNADDLRLTAAEIEKQSEQLKSHCTPDTKENLEKILCEISSNMSHLLDLYEKKKSALTSCQEKYQTFIEMRMKMNDDLEGIGTSLRDLCSQRPMSYKAAWMQWEKSKELVSKIHSYEEELLKLKRLSRELGSKCSENDYALLDKMVATQWNKWLYWLGVAQDWELYCEDLKQEWKRISEEIEREMILLDHFQEEVPDRTGKEQSTAQLQDSLLELKRFDENLKMQQLQLSLLLCRIHNILCTSESSEEIEPNPIIKEIQSMKNKCKILHQKAVNNEQELNTELKNRDELREDISAVKKSLQKVSTLLQDSPKDDPTDRKEQLEEFQSLIESEKEKAKHLMEKLTTQYSEKVPAELSLLQEECRAFLEETENRVKNEVLQTSPLYIMTRKVEAITSGLQSIEGQLTKKSENIIKAKDLQQKIWDELDVCHSKLVALESEVQDLAEEDPSQAQEWMDKLMDPMNQYQQVSYLVERRTVNLNKASSKLEEYEDILKSTSSWLQNTDILLNQEMKDCSAKVLSKHLNSLEIALDDCEQRHSMLDTINSELGELALIFETENLAKQLEEISSQVRDLLQRLVNILPHLQHVTNEVNVIESEVKRMERKADTIKTILTSNDIVDMSPKEHHKNGEVILQNIKSMKKTIAEIEAYKPDLMLSESGIQSFCVFRRTKQLFKELEMLENATKEQNNLLEPIMSELMELEQQQEKLRYLSKTTPYETSDIKEKTEAVKERLTGLNQKKEVVLLSLRSSISEQIDRLQGENQEIESETITSPVTEDPTLLTNEAPNTQAWVDSYFLPSLAEESEEDSFGAEAEDKVAAVGEKIIFPEPNGENIGSPSAPVPDGLHQGDPGQTLADVKSDPEMILRDCQGRVTEVELWLEKVNLSLAASKPDPEMQQTVEQQLADCQITLDEIEKKICALLDSDKYKYKGKGAWLKEAESLSLKLKTLKIDLENVQAMLQIKSADEQLRNGLVVPSATNGHLQLKDQGVTGSVQTDRTTVLNVKPSEESVIRTENQDSKVDSELLKTPQLHSRESFLEHDVVGPPLNIPLSGIEDTSWSKWQYLQKDLSYRIKNVHEPGAPKDIKIHSLPRFPVCTAKIPAEEARNFVRQLEALTEEAPASRSMDQEESVQRSLFAWLCSTSQWLQNTEEMFEMGVLPKEEAEGRLDLCKKLLDELETLSTGMANSKDTLLVSHADARKAVLSHCYENIQNWLAEIRIIADSRTKAIQMELEKNSNYQNDTSQLYEDLLKKKTDLIQLLNNGGSQGPAKQLRDVAVYETELYWFENQVSLLKKHGENLYIPVDLNQDIHKLEDVLNDLWRILRNKQKEFTCASVNQSVLDALESVVVDLLGVGREKVSLCKDQRSISKDALDTTLQNYKDFFKIFYNQVLLLETYSVKFCELELSKERTDRVVRDAHLLAEEAETCCIHMMSVLKGWKEFDSQYEYLCAEMDTMKSSIPSISLVEETEEKVKGRLDQYQEIKERIDANEPRLCQIILEGKKLLNAVNCQELEARVATMEQNWSQLSKKVNHELHRLEALVRHLASYGKESAELSLWLESAHQKLQSWKMHSLDASQDLKTVRHNLADFLEFTNDVDWMSSLKTSVLNTGSQLLRVKEADTTYLKVTMGKYEEKWAELIAALPVVQEKLQQLLMEKLPSRDAIHELMAWLEEVECGKEHEIGINTPTSLSDVRNSLQECKDFRKQMNHKQWIVDFVNQSLLQLSVGDVESKRYERTEFAERLGAMNLRWHQMQGNVNREIQHLEQILETLAENERKMQTLSSWFDAQQQRLNKFQHPLSIPAAESVLNDCLDLQEQLVIKTDAIDDLKKSTVETAGGVHSAPGEGPIGIDTLLKLRDHVANQIANLNSLMPTLIQNWKTYDVNLEEVMSMGMKTVYVLQQDTLSAPSLHSLRSHVRRLQRIQEEVEQFGEWEKVKDSLESLIAVCGPSVQAIVEEKFTYSIVWWALLNQELTVCVESANALLQVWESYSESYRVHLSRLRELEGKCDLLFYGNISEDKTADSLKQRLLDLQDLRQSIQELKTNSEHVSELANSVIQKNPTAADIIISEKETASHRVAHLERNIYSKTTELTLTMNEVDLFKSNLEALDVSIKSSAGVMDQIRLSGKEKEGNSDIIKEQLLQLSELSADVERLNEESFSIPLDDHTLKMLQNLNRMWSKTEATALEDCRELRMIQLEKNTFVQNYETWMQSLEKMENSLNGGIAGTFGALKTQQHIYERLQAEIAINEHILPSFVTKALTLLEDGVVENRSEFILKLTDLKEKWHSVIRPVQQREREVTALLKQWWTFNRSKQRLWKYLAGVENALTSVKAESCHSLLHTKKLLYDFTDKQQQLNRWLPCYLTTVDIGKELQTVADVGTKNTLQTDLSQLQLQWEKVSKQLGDTISHLHGAAQQRESFQWKIQTQRKHLHELKVRADDPLPTLHEELQRAREPTKELEEALDEWNQSLKDLDNMKTELSQYIVAEDGLILKKQVEALHRQWEELCLRVSMRRQEIEDRLNAWNIFNEKNKELCDWLTQMESKALQTADVNVEEMIEKLQKDCMEEINLFSENRNHLKQIGDQLIIASNKARATEIDNKLNKINDRWQHLFDIIGSRVKRLKETLVVIQQLEKSMSNLRTWLARIESELSKPVIYSICDDQEIQRKLTEQQDLQKDIELHSTGVASVLNICERLLHDTDACANETECDSIQQTTRSLDKRWRNICTMSMERRLRIEETWRLWQKFLEDYSRFEEWLKEAETMAAAPDSSEVLYTKAKEEQKKFEAFQRQIHERLTHLELINKQYRRLARENRTDAASKLKEMVHDGNQRWDQLQKRVSAILRRLKHFTSQRDEFEGTRDSIIVWLTEIDLQLTNVEHFSESNTEEKMQRLTEFQQEITLNTNKVDELIVFGEQLIQKSEAIDAVIIEDQLEELHRYFQEVFGRVSRFHQRLTNRDQHLEEERETSENDTDAEDSREFQNTSWHSTMHEVDTSHPSMCHLLPPPLPHERSGRETPVSVDSIPLEWDPTVDVGGSSMHENEEDGTYYNALSGKSDLDTASWHSTDKQKPSRKHEFEHGIMKGLLSATAETNTTFDLTSAAQLSTSTGAQESKIPSAPDQQQEDEGLQGFVSPGTPSGVIERWEILQAQSLSNELREKQNMQKWQQLTSDLQSITLWLDRTEFDLNNVRKLKPALTLEELEHKARRLKEILKAFDSYKALVISANISSKDFQQAEDSESREVLSRLHEVNTRWDKACNSRDEWQESLQSELVHCQEFHSTSDQLLLWLTEAEARRLMYRVADHATAPHVMLESQNQLTQLKDQLLERQIQVNTLKDMASCMLVKTSGDDYIEVDEKVQVIGNKLNQLMKDVSYDIKTLQDTLDNSALSDVVDSVGAVPADNQAHVGAVSKDTDRSRELASVRDVPKKPSFLYRVLRAAFPLQLLLLLLLLLACMIPFSEEDYSCTQANNFARSFYPMLRYMNGPPPT
ncbi:nesprin-2 isoform X2 [Pelobates cultripes]|uniref:Nesprin-2 isoform X2 n=1 Tax=Pelobates cultripes TaxID=61616 RepID=A0AAD1TK06_PELCU|nr:nesprin-2 isoform X2 [Pelobates cultripes]